MPGTWVGPSHVRRPTVSYFAPVTTFFLLVDWAGDGSFSHPDSDVSRDVVADIDCTRGRGDYGSQLFGRSEAGILRTRLRNDEGKYDVLNVQSSLGDLITTRRMVRLSMSYPEHRRDDALDRILRQNIRERAARRA